MHKRGKGYAGGRRRGSAAETGYPSFSRFALGSAAKREGKERVQQLIPKSSRIVKEENNS